MRRISVIASAAGALLLALTVGATGASADPTLALSRSAAAAGDVVQFSIAGAEDEVSYAVEVAEREVAEGEGVSGAFTMPDLGAAARTVTVRVEVVASDERTTLSRKLEYAPPPPVSSSPSAPAAAAPAPAVAPARPQQAAGSRPASGHKKQKKRPVRRPARKRRARPSPRARSLQRAAAARPNRRAAAKPRRRSSWGGHTRSTSAPKAVADAREPSPAADAKPGSEPASGPVKADGIFGRDLKPPLTLPLAALSSADAATDESNAGAITGMVVLAALALTAVAVAGPRRRRWAAARLGDTDDEVLQGVRHVPASRASSAPGRKS